MKQTNSVWQSKLEDIMFDYEHKVSPRGLNVKEIINGTYKVQMPACISLKSRNVNKAFMFAEAYWILSGSNRLEDVAKFMSGYRNFSDDQVFLRGAYGPKVVDQLPYVVDTLVNDNDSRQAVLTIWRERPGQSKDIPCTVAMQFFIRDSKLELVTTMRSNDIVLGFTYDVFTFSMIATAVQLLLRARGVDVDLGSLHVNAGSLHIYEDQQEKVSLWLNDTKIDEDMILAVEEIKEAPTYLELLEALRIKAEYFKSIKDIKDIK